LASSYGKQTARGKTVESGLYEYKIVYNETPHPKRTESVFFDRGWVASIEIDGYKVDVYADGDTHLKYRAGGGDYYYDLCSPNDFIRSDLDSDEKLEATHDDEDYYWVHNNWFDLYQNGNHLDQVTHTIDEAVESAKVVVAEHIVNVCDIENEGKPILQKDAILVLD
jgi:hypothetical protein